MKSIAKIAVESRRRPAVVPLRAKACPGVQTSFNRITVRQGTHFCAFLQQQMDAWDKERRKSFSPVDPVALARTPKIGGSTFAPAWAVDSVEEDQLLALQAETDRYLAHLPRSAGGRLASLRLAEPLPGGVSIFGIGKEKVAQQANCFDGYRGSMERNIITVCPGGQMPGDLVLSPYDVRAYKYLFAINRFGLHLMREMTPCSATVRGFPGHPQVAQCAAAGGEAFFNAPDKVVINLGSGRFPVDDASAADGIAKYFLACGMNEVTVLFSPRDFSVEPYCLKDRYGKDLPNKVYRRVYSRDAAAADADTDAKTEPL